MRTIYVVRTNELDQLELGNMFKAIQNRGFYAERARMELRPDFQQIIPSFVLRDKENKKILLYQRKSKHTEQRLAGMWTPVFGGHIDPQDWDKENTNDWVVVKDLKIPPVVYNGLVREAIEETGIEIKPTNLEFFTIIKDKSNDVGRVHTGIVFLLDVKINNDLKEQILSKSEINDIIEIEYKEFNMVLNSPTVYPLESWAKIIIDDLDLYNE